MHWILYLFCAIIIFHDFLLIFGLLKAPETKKHLFSIFIGVAMILMAIVSIGLNSWNWLILSYVGYRLLVMLDTIIPAIRQQRRASPLLPVNLFVVSGGLLAYITQWWIVFMISYAVSWIWTLIVGRRLLQEKK